MSSSSPYQIVCEEYKLMKKKNFNCSPNLGLDRYISTNNLGNSASGMILGKGVCNNIDVFVKIFAMTSNWISFERSGKKIYKTKEVVDNNCLEIGFTRLLSDLLFSDIPFTQNLVPVYGYGACKNGFETLDNISKCTGKEIITNFSEDEDYVVKLGLNLPQNGLELNYKYGNWDDQINFLVVASESGDLENLFKKQVKFFLSDRISENKINKIWNSIMLQIILTLFMLDDMFDGFSTNDLGPRNILFKLTDSPKDTYFQYNIFGNSYYVENMNIIPKLWDFSYCHISEKMKSMIETSPKDYFDYLRYTDKIQSVFDTKISGIIQFCTQLCEFSEFNSVENIECFKKIKEISKYECNDYSTFINLFKVYIPNDNSKLLQPMFNYN